MRTAVIIPCFNEAVAIAKVINEFRDALPEAEIYVYDNNSSDQTAETASQAGATVKTELRQGKGTVVRRMFADIEADIYILVDGDDTYHAASAPAMIKTLVDQEMDMVCANRIDSGGNGTYRSGHRFGNWLLTNIIRLYFGGNFIDVLTGYRAFSRRFVKSFPCLTTGFDIESELTIHSLALRIPVAEIPAPYQERPEGSFSKLSTVRDGTRILHTIVSLLRQEKPLTYYGALGSFCAAVSVILSIPVFITFLETGLVPRFPTAFLSMGLMILAGIFLICGLILDTVTKGRREMRLLAFLSIPHPSNQSTKTN
ncbi:MAG: glycosyltransferase family 2 protein [Kiritimatiellia bacterium]